MSDASIKLKVDGLSEFKSSMRQAQQSVKATDAELKLSAAEFEQTGDKEKYMKDQARLLTEKMDAQQKKVKAAKDAMEQLKKKGVDPTSAAWKDWKTKLANAETEMVKTQTQLGRLSDEAVDATKDFDKMGVSVKKAGGEISTIAKSSSFSAMMDGLDGISSSMSSITGTAKSVVTDLWNFCTETANVAVEIKNNAAAMSVDTEEYQRMAYAASTVGVSLEDIVKKKNEFTKDGKDFWGTIDQLSSMGEGAEQAAKAYELFGEDYAKMLALANNGGSQGWNDRMANASIVSDEDVQNAADFAKAWDEVTTAWNNTKIEIVSALAPLLTSICDVMKWVVDNKDIAIPAIAGIAGAFEAVKVGTEVVKFVEALRGLQTGDQSVWGTIASAIFGGGSGNVAGKVAGEVAGDVVGDVAGKVAGKGTEEVVEEVAENGILLFGKKILTKVVAVLPEVAAAVPEVLAGAGLALSASGILYGFIKNGKYWNENYAEDYAEYEAGKVNGGELEVDSLTVGAIETETVETATVNTDIDDAAYRGGLLRTWDYPYGDYALPTLSEQYMMSGKYSNGTGGFTVLGRDEASGWIQVMGPDGKAGWANAKYFETTAQELGYTISTLGKAMANDFLSGGKAWTDAEGNLTTDLDNIEEFVAGYKATMKSLGVDFGEDGKIYTDLEQALIESGVNVLAFASDLTTGAAQNHYEAQNTEFGDKTYGVQNAQGLGSAFNMNPVYSPDEGVADVSAYQATLETIGVVADGATEEVATTLADGIIGNLGEKNGQLTADADDLTEYYEEFCSGMGLTTEDFVAAMVTDLEDSGVAIDYFATCADTAIRRILAAIGSGAVTTGGLGTYSSNTSRNIMINAMLSSDADVAQLAQKLYDTDVRMNAGAGNRGR